MVAGQVREFTHQEFLARSKQIVFLDKQLSQSHDESGLSQLVYENRLFSIPDHTRVAIISSESECAQIRILNGADKGLVAWVHPLILANLTVVSKNQNSEVSKSPNLAKVTLNGDKNAVGYDSEKTFFDESRRTLENLRDTFDLQNLRPVNLDKRKRRNDEAQRALIKAGKAVFLQENTSIEILATGGAEGTGRKVRILNGPQKGKVFWITSGYLSEQR
jgi:hypothetical protein